MKNKVLFALFIVVWAHFLGAQDTDNQWFVLDTRGKNSTSMNGENIFDQDLTLSSFFTIEGVRHPDRSAQPKTKNNVFMIYDDGTFF